MTVSIRQKSPVTCAVQHHKLICKVHFADDMDVIAGTNKELQDWPTERQFEQVKNGDQPWHWQRWCNVDIYMNRIRLEDVNRFSYLGVAMARERIGLPTWQSVLIVLCRTCSHPPETGVSGGPLTCPCAPPGSSQGKNNWQSSDTENFPLFY